MLRPEFMMSSLSVTNHLNRNKRVIKLLQSIRDQFKIEHMALWMNDKVYLCTKGWESIHEADKTLLYLYKLVHNDCMIYDMPLFFTHTSLLEDMSQIGKIPYRFVILHLSDKFTLTIVSDPQQDINLLNEVIFLI